MWSGWIIVTAQVTDPWGIPVYSFLLILASLLLACTADSGMKRPDTVMATKPLTCTPSLAILSAAKGRTILKRWTIS